MLPTERTRGAAAAAIQPSAPASQQLFQDKERQVQRPAPAGTRGAPLPGRRARVQAFTCFIFPSLGASRRGQRSPPLSFLLHRQVFTGVLNLLSALFPAVPNTLTLNTELFCCTQQECSLQGLSTGVEAWAASTAD